MAEPITVMVVDDDPDNRLQLGLILETLGYEVTEAASGEEALTRLGALNGRRGPDALLLDVILPGISGLEMLKRYRASGGRAPVLMVSALDKADTVVQAMRLGATEYVVKPFNPDELREVLDRVLGDAGRPRAITPVRVGHTHLGQSAPMRRVAELVERIADADVPVLITGESGVGKDVVAREIHARSARREHVFVKINCAALPGELLESELFGHERGSFTGAQRTKPGQFELADGGTLFLDEIGEMPVSLQAKLLQALQDGEFYRVGGQRKIRVDSRVIVATNRNLERAIEQGTFREDLYYRLNVVRLAIPPLRERREDIPLLLEHFVEKYRKRYNRPTEQIGHELLGRFLQYDWPGNIRELENLVRRLMVLGDSRYVLTELREKAPLAAPTPPAAAPTHPTGMPSPVPPALGHRWPPPDGIGGQPVTPLSAALAAATDAAQQVVEESEFRIDLKEVGRKAAHAAEREAIVAMLGHTGGNKREAAERLGISYKAILYKIREFGIGRPRLARRPLPPSLPVPLPVPPVPGAIAAAAAAATGRDGIDAASRDVGDGGARTPSRTHDDGGLVSTPAELAAAAGAEDEADPEADDDVDSSSLPA